MDIGYNVVIGPGKDGVGNSWKVKGSVWTHAE